MATRRPIRPRPSDPESNKLTWVSSRLPWNVHYVSHEPERKFSDLLFENADLFDAFVKMPNMGGYAFPYSYKPAKAAKTHVANENFNPDFFIKLERLGTTFWSSRLRRKEMTPIEIEPSAETD